MVIQRLFTWVFTTLAVAALSLNAYDLPEIDSAVTTEFGVYEPVAVDVEPALGDMTVAADFSNVAFFETFSASFDNQALEILARNHFVAVPGGHKQIHDLYNWAEEEDLPRFITADGLLHTFHIVYDYALRILETERFQHDLISLNEDLLADLRLRSSSDPELAGELRRVVAFVALARKLARPQSEVPEEAADLVAAELALIDAHEGPEVSPILGYREDYSQYVPRGHYTRSTALENYFRAMMWYGRLGFRLRPGERPEEIEKGRSETRMALNLVASLSGLDLAGEPALEVWERIYRPTVFFVGSADDLTASEYAELAGQVYGKAAEFLTPEEIASGDVLENFISQAMELRPPRINSSLLVEGDASVVTKGFRVMGQRFIPDSYMLWKLVFPNVNARLMPRGLDVMAVLGSNEAERLLDETYGEFDRYPEYGMMLDSLKQEFASLPAATWAENLYWNWLYCLRPLFEEKSRGYPTFMLSEAWRRKELGTALGSWAQLRHDTILYAKQSYSFETSVPAPGTRPVGYVEPEPEVFARLSALARYMRSSLAERGVLPDDISWRLARFESLALSLKQIAEKELEARPISESDAEVIRTIGKTLENLVTFPAEQTSAEIQSEADEEMAVIADVHTDPNTLSALEVGVGYPLVLYVIVPTASGPLMTVGGMFSYYEFAHPISDRLTDEAWQQMLRSGQAPAPAEWLDGFLSLGEGGATEYASFPSRDESVEPRIDFPAGTVRSGDELDIRVEDTVGNALSVRFWMGDNLIAENSLSPDPSGGGVYSATVTTSGWPAGIVRAELIRDGQSGGSAFFELARAAGAATDLNNDGRTEIFDLIEMLVRLSRREAPDINGDGRGDVFDLLELLRILSQSVPEARMTALGPCQGEGVRSKSDERLDLTAAGGTVSFIHSSATYNCCMDSISVTLVTLAENHLRIVETEYAAEPCRCICDFTVFGEITDLRAGTYTVEVVSAAEPETVLCSSVITLP